VNRVLPFVAAQAPERDRAEHVRVARWVLDNLINVGSTAVRHVLDDDEGARHRLSLDAVGRAPETSPSVLGLPVTPRCPGSAVVPSARRDPCQARYDRLDAVSRDRGVLGRPARAARGRREGGTAWRR
jgi:hypothetical protein